MSLHWDRFDNAISDLWRFFAPAIVNFFIITFLLIELIVLIGDYVIEKISIIVFSEEQSQEFDRLISTTIENLKKKITELDSNVFDSVLRGGEGAASTFISFLIFLGIFIFLLDVLTRSFGAILPGRYIADTRSLFLRSELRQRFKAQTPPRRRFELWRAAEHWLDAQPELQEYRARRKNIRSSIAEHERYFLYLKSYITIIFIYFIIKIKDPNLFLPIAAFSIIFLIYINRFMLFKAHIGLIAIDLETYHFLNGENSDEINFHVNWNKKTSRKEPHFRRCIRHDMSIEKHFLDGLIQTISAIRTKCLPAAKNLITGIRAKSRRTANIPD